MKKIPIILTVLLLASPLFAASLDINVKVDKDKITIGERIRYDVEVEYDEGITPEPLSIGENLGEFEIKDYRIEEPKKNKDGRWVSRVSYVLSAYTIGEFTIFPITVKYKDTNGAEHEISSDEIKINVEKVKRNPDDKDDIRPLKNPVEIKSGFPRWLAVFFALVIIAAVLTWVYFRRKKTLVAKSILPPRPPEEMAFEELNALAGMRLVEKGLVKEYYIRMSDIIRRYIEARYKILALDRTTWELYQEMRIKRIERQHSDMIRDFLEECDLVKFAKYVPTQKEIEEIYKRAKEIVEVTTPKIVMTADGSCKP
jgi:hypothetical protein